MGLRLGLRLGRRQGKNGDVALAEEGLRVPLGPPATLRLRVVRLLLLLLLLPLPLLLVLVLVLVVSIARPRARSQPMHAWVPRQRHWLQQQIHDAVVQFKLQAGEARHPRLPPRMPLALGHDGAQLSNR